MSVQVPGFAVGEQVIDEITGMQLLNSITGDEGPNRLIAGHKGVFILEGGRGADQFVLSPSRKDFEKIQKGNNFGYNKADRIIDFMPGEGDQIYLDASSFKGLDSSKFGFKTVFGWKDLRAAASKGSKNKILAKTEEDITWLFYDSNGKEEGFGRNGGMFATIESAFMPGVNFSQVPFVTREDLILF